METLVIDNFKGTMTIYQDGNINSGMSYVINTFGNDPFTDPGNLTWSNDSVQIDSAGAVITDLIMAGKERVESGILYVYAIGHTGRLYKIQVNDPTTFNPDYDNPVLLATLSVNTPTFTRGGFIDFFGATERIYIGHDKGMTRIDFNGSNETEVGVVGSWTQNVPRPIKQFIGKMYVGNGSNLAEIDSTATVTTYAKLSPSFPLNTQVRDIDVSPSGTYLEAVVSTLALPNITDTVQDTVYNASVDSFIFKWNGTDIGYTAFTTFPSFSLTANTMFQNYQYTFGYDQKGGAVFNPSEKLLSLQEVVAPLPNSIYSTGNQVAWLSPLYFGGVQEADIITFGSLDFEVGTGYWDLFGQFATGTETDIIQTPFCLPVSNFGVGFSTNGYTNNIFGRAKVYFSTLETSSLPTTKYKFYKWTPPSSPLDTNSISLVGAIYQTQNQMFSKKKSIKEVRVYGKPWVAGSAFSIDLIGSSDYTGVVGGGIAGSSKTFTAGSNLTIGDDFAWYTPDCAPTYTLGALITNQGEVNHTIMKIEIDVVNAGK